MNPRKPEIISLPAPWGAAAALGLISLTPQPHRPGQVPADVLIQQTGQPNPDFVAANQHIIRAIRSEGQMPWLWSVDYMSLTSARGLIARGQVERVVNLQHVDLQGSLMPYARARLEGPWGWQLSHLERTDMEAAA
jgi:hypothetical protein